MEWYSNRRIGVLGPLQMYNYTLIGGVLYVEFQ